MTYSIVIATLVAMLASFVVHPYLVRIAHEKNIVDNPDARKLQKQPVPVLGGAAVFLGIIVGIGVTSLHTECSSLMVIITAMIIMLYVGMIDDILGLSSGFRFILEIILVVGLIVYSGLSINNLHGLWGVYELSMWLAIPLTIFAAVGIINAINLIDGVDGLSSGYCILACGTFCAFFHIVGQPDMAILAAAGVGSIIPFFLHNTLGKTSKMFIGDGGTLTMGITLSTFVVYALTGGSYSYNVDSSFSIVAFTLAVLSIPVFDTVRVMLSRIMRKTSPFHPDKTHLHHLFIDMRFSHVGTSIFIILLNATIIASQLIAWRLGASIELQLYIVIALGLLFTFGIYLSLRKLPDTNIIKRIFLRIGRFMRFEHKGKFLLLQKFIDKI